MDDFPCISEELMSIKDQLELIKSWKLKPDFLINLRVSAQLQAKIYIIPTFDTFLLYNSYFKIYMLVKLSVSMYVCLYQYKYLEKYPPNRIQTITMHH